MDIQRQLRQLIIKPVVLILVICGKRMMLHMISSTIHGEQPSAEAASALAAHVLSYLSAPAKRLALPSAGHQMHQRDLISLSKEQLLYAHVATPSSNKNNKERAGCANRELGFRIA